MKFYAEFKWPELADWYIDDIQSKDHLPWNDELRKLIDIHRMYRKWKRENPSIDEDNEDAIPQSILDELNTVVQIEALLSTTIFEQDFDEKELERAIKRSKLPEDIEPSEVCGYHLYPGLECKDYFSQQTSIARVSFDTTFDLDSLEKNELGIPLEGNMLDKVLPQCKWISGVIEFPIKMTPEQIEEEESDGSWIYIKWDLYASVAGMKLNVYGSGTKSLRVDKSE